MTLQGESLKRIEETTIEQVQISKAAGEELQQAAVMREKGRLRSKFASIFGVIGGALGFGVATVPGAVAGGVGGAVAGNAVAKKLENRSISNINRIEFQGNN